MPKALPSRPSSAIVVLLLVGGLGAGALTETLDRTIRGWPEVTIGGIGLFLRMCVDLAVCVGVSVPVILAFRGWIAAVLSACGFWATHQIGQHAAIWLIQPSPLFVATPVFLARLLVGWLTNGAILGVVGLVILGPVHILVHRVCLRSVVQTGSLCSSCAYDLVGLPAGHRCPECGRAPLETGRAAALLQRSGRALQTRWWILAAIVGVYFVVMVIHARHVAAPFDRALALCGRKVEGAFILPLPSAPGVGLGFGVGAFSALRPGDAYGLLTVVPQLADAPSPAMQIQVVERRGSWLLGTYHPVKPAVFCNLDTSQRRWVDENGIPPALREALSNAAEKRGPQRPSPVNRFLFPPGTSALILDDAVVVPVEDYFPSPK